MTPILLARIPLPISAGDLSLSPLCRELTGPAGTVRLTRGVFPVMHVLFRQAGSIVPTDTLMAAAWGDDADLEPPEPARALWSRIWRARAAIESVGVSGRRLELVFEIGYRLTIGGPSVQLNVTPEDAVAFARFKAAQRQDAAA